MASLMTPAALAEAQEHVRNVCADGESISLVRAVEGRTDEFGGVLGTTKYVLKSFPTRYTPFDRKVQQAISWSEDVDVIFYIAKKQVDTLGLTLKDLKQSKYVEANSKKYDLRYVEYYSAFGDGWLYIVIGAKK